MFQIKQDPSMLATLLYTTMLNAGYMDDLDEIVADKIESYDMDQLWTWANEVDSGIMFINEQLNMDIKLSAINEINKQLEEF